MKKTCAFFLAALLMAVFLPSCAINDEVETLTGVYTREFEGTTLNVYNWAEFISDGAEGSLDTIAAFEKLTGINVNYSMYESNEVMYSKLKSGSVSYDVIIPSDYMVQRLINEGMLLEIDTSKLSNYGNITDEYKNLYFDPENKYSVPYSVGMVGLIYNSTMVDEAPTSWSILFDESYKGDILMFNNSRDAFAIAQAMLGIDFNTTDTSEWDRAAELLKTQKAIIQGYVMDEVFNKMEDGNAALSPYYAGDYLTMKDINPDLEFVYPDEGVNIFVDSMCIPSSCKNYDAAMLFINFMLEGEVALANAEYICYATPNKAVLEHPDYSLRDSEILYPAVKPKTQYFEDIDAVTRKYYEDLWVQITFGK